MAWYLENGPESDVVFSSRVRLARNFSSYPFPVRMDDVLARKVLDDVKQSVLDRSETREYGFSFYDMKTISTIERQVLVEKHLISPDLAEAKHESGALVSEDEHVSIMLNEEDHLRIQCLFPGMQLKKALRLCNKIDDFIDGCFEYAYSPEFGYLTCCPSNIGTGMRASIMLHLPALAMSDNIGRMLEACAKLGLAARGLYGENTEASGNLFQISNQVTLGQTEEEILDSVKNTVMQVIEKERAMRNEMYNKNRSRFEDRIYRAYGILKNARVISTGESMQLLSYVRLGIDMGIISDIETEKVNEVMLSIQPAFLQNISGKTFTHEERDEERARLVRESLKAK